MSAEEQNKLVADHIMFKAPGEPSQSEGAGTRAVRLLKAATYFVITYGTDGDTYIVQKTEAELLEMLNPNEQGDVEIIAAVGEEAPFITEYLSDKALIIKGEIIVPKAKEVVIRFEL